MVWADKSGLVIEASFGRRVLVSTQLTHTSGIIHRSVDRERPWLGSVVSLSCAPCALATNGLVDEQQRTRKCSSIFLSFHCVTCQHPPSKSRN